jgi:hypothetical protein
VAVLLLVGCAASRSEESRKHVPSRTIEQALEAHGDSLRALPGVVGTAIGLCDGAPCIRVFLADSAAARTRIPAELDGHPVRAEVTGPIRPRDRGGA